MSRELTRQSRPDGSAVSFPVRDTPSPYAWLAPPSDGEKLEYLTSQHRWIFVASAVAFLGVVYSFAGLAAQSYWTAVFFLPLALLVVEQVCAVRTSTLRRQVTLPDHQVLVRSYAPADHSSVDVFLPTAGEDLDLLENTYRYVRQLNWPGRLTVNVLDDAGRVEVAELAGRYGFRYLARPGKEFKKAGNLEYGLERTDGDFVLILDADFVPRSDLLLETMPYFQDATVGIVQTPQYFSTSRSMSWLERCAGATQELFFRHIQPSRDAAGAAICVGTSAVYRRSALAAIGGFPRIGHSEDVFTGVLMARAGFRLRYVPVLLSRGRCPDTVGAFLAQQYRWCEGSMALVADREFHEELSMTTLQRVSFWAGFLYYATTAMNAVLAPLPILAMVLFFPGNVAALNMLPLTGVVVLWLVILPCVSHGRWRPEVLRVQTLYGFAHLLSMTDLLRGRLVEWVATGVTAGPRRSVAQRVRRFMIPYLVVTQTAVALGLVRGAVDYGLSHFWANISFALLGAYVFVPVAWAASREAWISRSSMTTIPSPTAPAEIGRTPEQVVDLRDAVVHAHGRARGARHSSWGRPSERHHA